MDSRDCCLAVVKDLQTAGRACLELQFGGGGDIAISIFGKPGGDADSADFFRIKDIGTIICRGPVAGQMKRLTIGRNDELICFENVLNLIGISAHHEDMYSQALRSGLIIMVLQGSIDLLRQGCSILEEIALWKPVLYLA